MNDKELENLIYQQIAVIQARALITFDALPLSSDLLQCREAASTIMKHVKKYKQLHDTVEL